jgi:hypothetical protein
LMKAVVFEKGQLLVKGMPAPAPKAGEVLVAIKAAGLNRRRFIYSRSIRE